MNLVVFIESAIAMINLVDICKTSRELANKGRFIPVALVCGSDDLCASIGATRTEDSTEILYARQKLVLVAKAFGLQAIDMGYIQYKGNKAVFHRFLMSMRIFLRSGGVAQTKRTRRSYGLHWETSNTSIAGSCCARSVFA